MCKVGLVLEGGASRGIFTAGVLDYMLENNVSFPYVVGVSAGAGNAAGFVSKQNGKVKGIIMREGTGAYYGVGQMLHSRKLLDTENLLDNYFGGNMPFDFDTFFESSAECEFVVTSCETGRPEYLCADGSRERLRALTKATCSVPFLCSPVPIEDKHYLDGSLSDSVPAEHALKNKCDKVVVVLTRRWEIEPPTDYSKLRPLINIGYSSKYPKLADVLIKRKENYESQMHYLSALENDGTAFVIRPESMGIGHFERDAKRMNEYYIHGKEVMERRMDALCDFMKAS